MGRLEGLGKDLELQRRRLRARLGKVARPGKLTSELHNIAFLPGEKVIDTVTGQEVEVVGSGVEQIERP